MKDRQTASLLSDDLFLWVVTNKQDLEKQSIINRKDLTVIARVAADNLLLTKITVHYRPSAEKPIVFKFYFLFDEHAEEKRKKFAAFLNELEKARRTSRDSTGLGMQAEIADLDFQIVFDEEVD